MSAITQFLGFTKKPRDAAVGGIPLTQNSQLVLIWRNRTTPATNVRVIARTYNPSTDQTSVKTVIGPLSSVGTTFLAETTGSSVLGTFSDGELLVSVFFFGDSTTNPGQTWGAVFLQEGGQLSTWLCEGYPGDTHAVGWTAGSQSYAQMAKADVARDGALYSFQGEVINGAGGAGDQSLTIAAAAGSRVRVRSIRASNGDIAARTLTIRLLDAVGGNVLHELATAVSLTAAAATNWPVSNALAAGDSPGSLRDCWIAGANVLVGTLAAVALSQNSLWSCVLEVWGGPPILTLAGASTPTLTVNTSRFETG